jgi:hypothetical protein
MDGVKTATLNLTRRSVREPDPLLGPRIPSGRLDRGEAQEQLDLLTPPPRPG